MILEYSISGKVFHLKKNSSNWWNVTQPKYALNDLWYEMRIRFWRLRLTNKVMVIIIIMLWPQQWWCQQCQCQCYKFLVILPQRVQQQQLLQADTLTYINIRKSYNNIIYAYSLFKNLYVLHQKTTWKLAPYQVICRYKFKVPKRNEWIAQLICDIMDICMNGMNPQTTVGTRNEFVKSSKQNWKRCSPLLKKSN